MINFKTHSVSVSSIATIVFVLVMTFYPLVAVVPWFLSVPSNPISVSYRLVYLLLSFLIISYGVVNIKRLRFSYGMYAFVLFWIIYIIRLIYDLSIRNIQAYASDFYLYTFAIGGCFLPALAVAIAMSKIESKKLIRLYWYFLFLANGVVLAQLVAIYGLSSDVLTERLRITSEGQDVFNPIPLSRGGAMLALMSLFFLLFKHHRFVAGKNGMVLAAFILGLVNLTLGASRGPIASFFIVAFLVVVAHAFLARKSVAYFLKVVVINLIASLSFIFYIAPLISEGRISIIKRTMSAIDGGFGEEYRAYQWKAAFGQIKESPVWGERIVEVFANFYPHNIFIEIVLATGVVGGVLFLAICSDLFKKFIHSIRTNDIFAVLFFLLGLQFMFGLSGLSIPTGWYFWMLIAVCLSYRACRNKDSQQLRLMHDRE